MLCFGLISILFSVPLFSYCITARMFNRITCIILIYCTVLSINTFNINTIGIFNGLFHVSPSQITFDAFIFICGAIILIAFNKNKKSPSIEINEVPIIVIFAIIGQSILIRSNDIFSIYISLELQSFAVYVLCTLYRQRERATIAGLKYFLLGGLRRAIILLGIALIYFYTGNTQFEDIFALWKSLGQNDYIQPIVIGICLIQIGFLFKIARAPIHNWAPDVYDGLPTIITIFVQTMPKISILLFIVEILSGSPRTSRPIFETSAETFSLENLSLFSYKNLLLYASLSSLVIGTSVGLRQYRIKRLLAYSSISHVGFLLLCVEINTQQRIATFLFYLVQYSLTNICVFMCILAFAYANKNYVPHKILDIEKIGELKNQFISQPLLSFSLILCLFSIAGIPPLVGFFAKMIVLSCAINQGYYFMSIVCVVVSVIRAVYYLKIVKILYFKEDKTIEEDNIIVFNNESVIRNTHSFAITILTIIITFYIAIPEILLNTSKLLAISLFYN